MQHSVISVLDRSWHEHRRTAKARRAHGKHGSHLHLRLPWRRRHEDEAANQQRRCAAVQP